MTAHSHPIPASNGRTEAVRSEMVERVGRAIYAEFENCPLYAQAQMNGVLANELARVAIEAMLEPTQAMVDAVEHNIGDCNGGERIMAMEACRAMIQAALPDPQAREREEGA